MSTELTDIDNKQKNLSNLGQLSNKPYKGARDFYPTDMRLRELIFGRWRDICKSYGYEEYDAPIIEPVELFASKSGDELVNEQSYHFTDRGGREVMLRPEMTPSLSRLIAGKRQELPLPIRWFSIPNCWRYERPQKGRGREFYQLNIDIFGVESNQADIEMLMMIKSIMHSFGAKSNQYQIRVNSRKIIDYVLGDYLGLSEVEQKTVQRLIDRMPKMERHEFIGLVDSTITPSLREAGVTEKLLAILDTTDINNLPEGIIDDQAVQSVKKIIETASGLGVDNIVYDVSLVRGLDYYNDFVFEVFDTNPDNNRAMFGGGRYDGLISMFGVESLATVGFGISDVMLIEFLRGHNLLPEPKTDLEVTIIPVGDTEDYCQNIASDLRGMGVNTSIDYTDRKTDKKLKASIKSGVRYVIFIGDKEVEDSQYTLKDLHSNDEHRHSIERIVSLIKDHRKV